MRMWHPNECDCLSQLPTDWLNAIERNFGKQHNQMDDTTVSDCSWANRFSRRKILSSTILRRLLYYNDKQLLTKIAFFANNKLIQLITTCKMTLFSSIIKFWEGFKFISILFWGCCSTKYSALAILFAQYRPILWMKTSITKKKPRTWRTQKHRNEWETRRRRRRKWNETLKRKMMKTAEKRMLFVSFEMYKMVYIRP